MRDLLISKVLGSCVVVGSKQSCASDASRNPRPPARLWRPHLPQRGSIGATHPHRILTTLNAPKFARIQFWGSDGYIYMKRGGNDCGIASDAVYAIVRGFGIWRPLEVMCCG